MRAAALGVLCALASAPAHAQQIRGVVREHASSEPIADATITAADANGQTSVRAVTDSLGRFALPLPFPGEWTVRAEHIAYTTLTADALTIAPSEHVEVEILLAVGVIALEPLVVRSREQARLGRLREFYDRMEGAGRTGEGRFLTREDFERRPGVLITGQLATLAGIIVRPVRSDNVIFLRGGSGLCRPAIYLDGVEVGPEFAAMIDRITAPETLEGAEVYRSSIETPIFYRKPNCGAILLWSRAGQGEGSFAWKRLIAGMAAFIGIFFVLRSL